MIRVFISQPMRGKSDEQIIEEREAAITKINELFLEEVHIIRSFIPGTFKNAQTTPLLYLGEALKHMATADVVYFCRGWDQARGCKIEHECAVAYGKTVILEEDND